MILTMLATNIVITNIQYDLNLKTIFINGIDVYVIKEQITFIKVNK
jgi:hypothetical protein